MNNTALDMSQIFLGQQELSNGEAFKTSEVAYQIISENPKLMEKYLEFKAAVILLSYQSSLDSSIKLDLKSFYKKLLKNISNNDVEDNPFGSFAGANGERPFLVYASSSERKRDLDGLLSSGMKHELGNMSKDSNFSLPVDSKETPDISFLEDIIAEFCDEKGQFRQELATKYARYSQGAGEEKTKRVATEVSGNVVKANFRDKNKK